MKAAGLLASGLICLCAFTLYGVVSKQRISADTQSTQIPTGPDSRIKNYQSWHKVNEERVLMETTVALMCNVPKQYNRLNPHVSKYITVYVNELGKAAMLSKETVKFPVGSIIVKEKYGDRTGGRLEMLTIMIKREKGFDASVGDWEFLNADREDQVYRNVDFQHCITCHQQKPEADFTFRSYLTRN